MTTYCNPSSEFFFKFGKVSKFLSRFRKSFDFHGKYLSLPLIETKTFLKHFDSITKCMNSMHNRRHNATISTGVLVFLGKVEYKKHRQRQSSRSRMASIKVGKRSLE